MVNIKIKKGLDIPIEGHPNPNGGVESLPAPSHISLHLDPFEDVKFHLIAKPGDIVKIGEPIAEDKECKGRMFVSPAGGVIEEVRRGHKRRLLDVVIAIKDREEHFENPPLNPNTASREEIIEALKRGRICPHTAKAV